MGHKSFEADSESSWRRCMARALIDEAARLGWRVTSIPGRVRLEPIRDGARPLPYEKRWWIRREFRPEVHRVLRRSMSVFTASGSPRT